MLQVTHNVLAGLFAYYLEHPDKKWGRYPVFPSHAIACAFYNASTGLVEPKKVQIALVQKDNEHCKKGHIYIKLFTQQKNTNGHVHCIVHCKQNDTILVTFHTTGSYDSQSKTPCSTHTQQVAFLLSRVDDKWSMQPTSIDLQEYPIARSMTEKDCVGDIKRKLDHKIADGNVAALQQLNEIKCVGVAVEALKPFEILLKTSLEAINEINKDIATWRQAAAMHMQKHGSFIASFDDTMREIRQAEEQPLENAIPHYDRYRAFLQYIDTYEYDAYDLVELKEATLSLLSRISRYIHKHHDSNRSVFKTPIINEFNVMEKALDGLIPHPSLILNPYNDEQLTYVRLFVGKIPAKNNQEAGAYQAAALKVAYKYLRGVLDDDEAQMQSTHQFE